jgi:hypothetical protein
LRGSDLDPFAVAAVSISCFAASNEVEKPEVCMSQNSCRALRLSHHFGLPGGPGGWQVSPSRKTYRLVRVTIKEAQAEATRRWGEYGVAMIDGSVRYEVGFFDGPNVATCGFVRLGCGSNFEEAFSEADSDAASKLVSLFYPKT